jgi:hypothetical protein
MHPIYKVAFILTMDHGSTESTRPALDEQPVPGFGRECHRGSRALFRLVSFPTSFANTLTLSSIEADAAKILMDPFLSGDPSQDKGWIGSRAGEDSTQGGVR